MAGTSTSTTATMFEPIVINGVEIADAVTHRESIDMARTMVKAKVYTQHLEAELTNFKVVHERIGSKRADPVTMPWEEFMQHFRYLLETTESSYVFASVSCPEEIKNSYRHKNLVDEWAKFFAMHGVANLQHGISPEQAFAVTASRTMVDATLGRLEKYRLLMCVAPLKHPSAMVEYFVKMREHGEAAKQANSFLTEMVLCTSYLAKIMSALKSEHVSKLAGLVGDYDQFCQAVLTIGNELKNSAGSQSAAKGSAQTKSGPAVKTEPAKTSNKKGNKSTAAAVEALDGPQEDAVAKALQVMAAAIAKVTDDVADVKAKVQLDSGADTHVASNRSDFSSYVESPRTIRTVGGDVLSPGYGTINLPGKSKGTKVELRNVRHIPGSFNLVSTAALEREGKRLVWNAPPLPVEITDSKGTVLLEFGRKNSQYVLNPPSTKVAKSTRNFILQYDKDDITLWHSIYGHISEEATRKTMIAAGLKPSTQRLICDTCDNAKDKRQPSGEHHERAKEFLDVVHMDCGGGLNSLPPGVLVDMDDARKTKTCATRFVLLIDDATRFRWIAPIEKKTDVNGVVKQFIEMCKVQYKTTPRAFRADGGGEFQNNAFKTILRDLGIVLNLSGAGTPDQNGLAERHIQTVVNTTRSMFIESGMPAGHWPEGMRTAVHTLNRIWNKTIGMSPYEKAFGKPPNTLDLQVFGSMGLAHEPKNTAKLAPRTREVAFLGYGDTQNLYKVVDIHTSRVLLRRDVTFNKRDFPVWDPEIAALKSSDEISWDEAMNGPNKNECLEAAKEHMAEFWANEAFELVERDSIGDSKIMTGKWLFRIKSDGKWKARWVVRGFTEPDVTQRDAYADVLHAVTIRMFLQRAACKNYVIVQGDAVSAYLNALMRKQLYMMQPTGFSAGKGLVCKILKAMYGLRTAPREWQECLEKALTALGFKPLVHDPCVFARGELQVSVWVDDFKFSGPTLEEIKNLLNELNEKYFRVKDLGPCDKYLGMEVSRDKDGTVYLSQVDKILAAAEPYGLTECRPAYIPIADDSLLAEETRHHGTLLDDIKRSKFRSTVGLLIHIMSFTRPDIAYAVGRLCRFMELPTDRHYSAMMHLLRYLVTTKDKRLTFRPGGFELRAASDASWAKSDDAHSVSGNVFLVNGTPVAWLSKKQLMIALSTCEAEYIAATLAARDVEWISGLHAEIFGIERACVTLEVDNKSAITTAENRGFNPRNRHYLIRDAFLRQMVSGGKLKLQYTPTSEMPADGLTKALARPAHNDFCKTMSLS